MNNSILLPSTLQELDIDTKELSNRIKQSSSHQVLKIFQSDDFTPEILIHYFMATFNEPGPHQYLTNRLYHMPNKFVEYYIPQFVYMVIKIGSQSMETFLESLCSINISNYFKIVWCLNAYSQDERNNQKSYKKLEFFQRRLEKEMVNGAIKFNRENVVNNMQNQDFQEQLIKQCKEKEFRSQYIFLLDRFLIQMIQLSLTLKSIQHESRKQYLLDYIGKGNRAIQRMRNINRELPYYWGIIIPFAREHETKDASNLIIHICEEGAACFNTKTRVPYRILIETISIQELEGKAKILTLENPQENTDGEDFIQMIPPNNLEEIMKQMTHEKQTDTIYNQLLKYESQSSSFRDFDDLKQDDQSSPLKSKERRSNSWSDKEASSENIDQNKKRSRDTEDGLDEIKQQQNLSNHGSSTKIIQQNKTILDENVMTPLKLKKIERALSEKIKIKKQGPWGEDWNDKFERIKQQSPFKDFESYRIRAIMVKGGDDLRQELLAMQVIQKMNEIFRQAQLNVYLKPYEIIVTSENSGILEFVQNSISMDGLKKYLKKQKLSLHEFYKQHFENEYQQAQQNFVESLAGYSLLCYFLQIKDRHNGNILVDNQGHLIHIDFGFILSISPGNMGFERAPFKITNDYLEIMEGQNSRLFDYFRRLMFSGFMEVRKYCASIFQIIEIMMEKSNFNCFKYFNFNKLKQRFMLHETDLKCREYVEKLIQQSIDDNRTFYYDKFQYMTNGIEP